MHYFSLFPQLRDGMICSHGLAIPRVPTVHLQQMEPESGKIVMHAKTAIATRKIVTVRMEVKWIIAWLAPTHSHFHSGLTLSCLWCTRIPDYFAIRIVTRAFFKKDLKEICLSVPNAQLSFTYLVNLFFILK